MGQRHLVTGGAGFIGSHLVEAILARGDSVVVLDDFSTGRMANLGSVRSDPGFELVHGTVLDELLVEELVGSCQVVVHLAAAVGVRLIVEHPMRSFTRNTRGSQIVVDAASRHRRRILLASSSEIYGRNRAVPLSEDAGSEFGSPTVGRWAYGVAKAVDEVLAATYHRERGLASTVVRLFNTVGPRQSPAYGMVVPRLARQAVRGEPLTVYGDGTQTRCFCHVADVVDALLRLLPRPEAIGEVFNVGGTHEGSILELARRVNQLAGRGSEVRLIPYHAAYPEGFEDLPRRVPDTAKLRRLTGWTPSRTLDQTLLEVLAEAEAEVRDEVEAAEGAMAGSR